MASTRKELMKKPGKTRQKGISQEQPKRKQAVSKARKKKK